MRQIVNNFVCAEWMPCQNDIFIIFSRKIQICVNIFVGVGKSFVPWTDKFFFARVDVDGFNFAERVVGLRVNKIDAVTWKRVADVVVKRIGVKISVNARYRNDDGFSRILRRKQNAVQNRAASRFNI